MHCLDGKEEAIAEKKFNLKIIQFREADFKNSFEHIAGMASACDLINSVATTNGSVIPGALGLNVIEIRQVLILFLWMDCLGTLIIKEYISPGTLAMVPNLEI